MGLHEVDCLDAYEEQISKLRDEMHDHREAVDALQVTLKETLETSIPLRLPRGGASCVWQAQHSLDSRSLRQGNARPSTSTSKGREVAAPIC